MKFDIVSFPSDRRILIQFLENVNIFFQIFSPAGEAVDRTNIATDLSWAPSPRVELLSSILERLKISRGDSQAD